MSAALLTPNGIEKKQESAQLCEREKLYLSCQSYVKYYKHTEMMSERFSYGRSCIVVSILNINKKCKENEQRRKDES